MQNTEPKKVWGLYCLANVYVRNITLFGCALFSLVFMSGYAGLISKQSAEIGIVVGVFIAMVPAIIFTLIKTPIQDDKN